MKSCINYQKTPSLRAEVNKDRIVINKALKNGETQKLINLINDNF